MALKLASPTFAMSTAAKAHANRGVGKVVFKFFQYQFSD